MVRKINIIHDETVGDYKNPLYVVTQPLYNLYGQDGKLVLTEPVENFIQDLWDTFNSLDNALGLAANQIWHPNVNIGHNPDHDVGTIGIPKIFIAVIEDVPRLFLDPIIKGSGGTTHSVEACFSVPDFVHHKVHRKRNVLIKYYNSIGEYKEEKYFFKDDVLTPMILQHEYDHLMGKLIKDVK